MNKPADYKGLTSSEAVRLLQRDGYNEIQSERSKSGWRIAVSVMKEPMLLLLLSCGILYLFLGDTGEGMLLMASMLLVIGISVYQHKRTERALEKLRDLSSPRALVIRDGNEARIPGREVVAGDIVILQEGDRVPADAVVLSAVNLQADESLLTGESAAVGKNAAAQNTSGAEAENESRVYSGTLLVRGHGIAKVTATGSRTELGKIGRLLHNIEEEPTLLQVETRRIIRTFFILGVIVCALLIIVYGITRDNWLDGVLYGLSLAMAMMPEEFAVVLTLFLILGSLRLSKNNVLTRQSNAIETLGSMTVLCTDKTGTLTENKMSIRKLWSEKANTEIVVGENGTINTDAPVAELMRVSCLAGQPAPFDPMEKAIVGLTMDSGISIPSARFIHEFPLTPGLLAMSRIYEDKNTHLVAAKGAPEAIARLCKMSGVQLERYNARVKEFAAQGYRLLGVASAEIVQGNIPPGQEHIEYTFMGLLAMEDPMRKSVPDNVRSCYTAGIRIIMVTGDYPVTAQHIAKQMGLKDPENVITGKEIAEMNDLQLQQRLKTTNIFARVVPEQKVRLVEALKANGEIIGMTGDGVNDAPALRAAHIGIAMGQRGTDVAREAADLVLLDDNFASVISAVKVGRRIFDNIRKAMIYVFAVHIPIAGMTLLPVFFTFFPVILFPVHIAFLELIIDPASTLIFESETEEKNIMTRPPAPRKRSSFGIRKITLGFLLGLSVFAIGFVVLLIARQNNVQADEIRALTFTTLVIANLVLIYTTRSFSKSIIELIRTPNPSVKWVAGGAVALLGAVLFIPPLRNLFHFAPLHLDDVVICLSVAVVGMIWFEILKAVNRKKHVEI